MSNGDPEFVGPPKPDNLGASDVGTTTGAVAEAVGGYTAKGAAVGTTILPGLGTVGGAVAGAILDFASKAGTLHPRVPFYYEYPKPNNGIFRLSDFTQITTDAELAADFAGRDAGALGKAGQSEFHTLFVLNENFNGSIEIDGKLYDKNIINIIEAGDFGRLSVMKVLYRPMNQEVALGALGAMFTLKNAFDEAKRKYDEYKAGAPGGFVGTVEAFANLKAIATYAPFLVVAFVVGLVILIVKSIHKG